MVQTAVTSARASVASHSSTSSVPQKDDTAEALEAALEELGPFGFYQGYLLVLLCIPNLLAVMYSLNYVFVADSVPFRCQVPECEGWDPTFVNASLSALLPPDSCQRYTPLTDETSCLREDYHPTDTIACNHFVYETQYSTIFVEFDLGCREWMRTLVGTVRQAALPVALVLTGYLSDTYGRRTAFCIFSALAGVMGVIKAFSINYAMYLSMEFLEAALGYGFNSAAYVMMVEIAHPSLRAVFACATGMTYGVGGMLFAWLAWAVPYWRHLLLLIHALALLLPTYWLLLDESPRWLHVKGHGKKAVSVIRKAARWNKVQVKEELMKRLEEDSAVEEQRSQSSPWLAMLCSRVLMFRFAMCCWCWVVSAFVYYGLTINSVSLSGNKYVNFALNMAMEVAASVLIMMALERVGRKRCIFVAYILCGVVCVTPFVISITHQGTSLGLFMVGKLAITFAFNSLYVYTAELYPTHVRSSALAACSIVGRLGSVAAPQTPLLDMYVQALLYGITSALAALAVLFLPETRLARLPQRVQDAETLRAPSSPPAPQPLINDTPHVYSADT